MLDKQLIIQEIAKRHKVVLGEDDPIFSIIYLHDVIFDQYTSRTDQTVQSLAMEVEAITARYRENSRELAEQIIGKAVEVARIEIRKSGNETADAWRSQMVELLEQQAGHLSAARSASRLALVAAGMSAFALLAGVMTLVILA